LIERDPAVWLDPEITRCTPNHAHCPLAGTCARAKAPIPTHHASMADFSNELLTHPAGVVCVQFMAIKAQTRKYRAGRH
jgi:hypothetical protein